MTLNINQWCGDIAQDMIAAGSGFDPTDYHDARAKLLEVVTTLSDATKRWADRKSDWQVKNETQMAWLGYQLADSLILLGQFAGALRFNLDFSEVAESFNDLVDNADKYMRNHYILGVKSYGAETQKFNLSDPPTHQEVLSMLGAPVMDASYLYYWWCRVVDSELLRPEKERGWPPLGGYQTDFTYKFMPAFFTLCKTMRRLGMDIDFYLDDTR